MISNKLKFNKEPIYDKARPNEVYHAFCSSDKARKILSYKTNVKLSESLDKMIDFIKLKGPEKFEYNYIEVETDITPQTWTKNYFNNAEKILKIILLQFLCGGKGKDFFH